MKRPALALLALLCGQAMADSHPFTVDDMWSMQRVGAPIASPNAQYIVFSVSTPDMATNKSRSDLYLRKIDGNDAPRRLTTHDASDVAPQWSADSQSIYFLSSRSGSMQLWRIAVNGGEAEQVSRYDSDVNAYKLSPTGKHVLIGFEVFSECKDLACNNKKEADTSAKKNTGKHFDRLFVRHWDTWKDGHVGKLFIDGLNNNQVAGEPKLLVDLDADVPTKPFGGDEEWNFSSDGKQVFFVARLKGKTESWSTNSDIYQVNVDGSALKNLTEGNLGYDQLPVVSPNGKSLAYVSMARAMFEADKFAIKVRDLTSGATRDISTQIDRSFGNLQWSADSKTVYATADDLGNHSLFALDASNGKVSRVINKGTVASYTVAGRHIVYGLDNLKSPVELYRMAATGGNAQKLTSFNDERLKSIKFGDYEQFSFAGVNNEKVYGYIVKPANFDANKKYPMALLVHGGPQGSFGDHFHYRWNPQTYTGQGFVAVMIDFHGSTGYGQAFTDSISGDWGGKPLVDLQKGMDHVAKTYAFANTDRACALGGSYGGFMMAWIAGNWSDKFKCLVNHAGISDSRAMYYTTEEIWFDEWEHGGPQFQHPEHYEKFNPINHVSKWQTPTLVIHGLKDYRVPYSQGLATFTALQRRGIDSEFLVFPDENHWILKPQNSKQWHEAVNSWLHRHLD